MRIGSLLFLLSFTLPTFPLFAQDSPSKGVWVSVMPENGHTATWSRVRNTAKSVLTNRLKELGIGLAERPQLWVVLTDARQSGDSIVIFIQVGHSVPEEVVHLSRDAEVFYASLPPEKRVNLPKEGKWVRETVTEEYIRQFMLPLEGRLLVVASDSLDVALRREADRLAQMYFAEKKR